MSNSWVILYKKRSEAKWHIGKKTFESFQAAQDALSAWSQEHQTPQDRLQNEYTFDTVEALRMRRERDNELDQRIDFSGLEHHT